MTNTPDDLELSEEEQDEIAKDIAALNARKKGTGTRKVKSIIDEDAPPPKSGKKKSKKKEEPASPPEEEPALPVDEPAPPEKEEVSDKSIPPTDEEAPAMESESDEEVIGAPAGDSIFDEDDFNEKKSAEGDKPKEDKIKPKSGKKSQPKETAQERGLVETKIRVWDAHTKKYSLDEEEVSVLSATETDGAKAETGLGFTVNLGDMEFARVDARVHLPTTTEDLPAAFNTAWKIADGEVRNQVQKIRSSSLNNKKAD